MTKINNTSPVLIRFFALIIPAALLLALIVLARGIGVSESASLKRVRASRSGSQQQNKNKRSGGKTGSSNQREMNANQDAPDNDNSNVNININYNSNANSNTNTNLNPSTLKESVPQSLGGCSLGSGVNESIVKLNPATVYGGSSKVQITFDDSSATNEYDTVIRLWVNEKEHDYWAYFTKSSSTVTLNLASGPLLTGDRVQVRVDERYKASSAAGCAETSKSSTVASALTLLNTPPPNPLRLKNSSANLNQGCHGQGIKFDGLYFFSTCQELYGDNMAVAHIHDSKGNKLCSFNLGNKYDHPGGPVIYPGETGTAYLGLSDLEYGNSAMPVKISYDPYTKKCLSTQPTPTLLNNKKEVADSIGFAVRVPTNECSSANSWTSLIRFYNDETYKYFPCDKSGAACGAQVDVDNPTTENSSQDCGYYWEGAWFRACIAFSDADNEIQIFRADGGSMDAGHRLGQILLSSKVPNVGKSSGGFDIYTTPTGTRYVVIAPDSGDKNCGGEHPCTTEDADKAQLVEFYNFNTWSWPSNSTAKICK